MVFSDDLHIYTRCFLIMMKTFCSLETYYSQEQPQIR